MRSLIRFSRFVLHGAGRWLTGAACLLVGTPSVTVAAESVEQKPELAPAEVEFFEKEIRPLLAKHCYECHSSEAEELKGGLHLDSRPGVLHGGNGGKVVVSGKPEQSRLIRAVRYEDPSLQMPPDGKLPDSAIAALEKWVRIGLPDPRSREKAAPQKNDEPSQTTGDLWSFRPVTRPAIPNVENTAWPASPIDRFILARLENEGLAPVDDADRRTLIRRAYFDLIGLPPKPAEIERFVNDDSPDAWPRLIDRLLASPHFGEWWGRHWLDVARYAESSGGGRTLIFDNAWRYRDYTIESFNDDKPYDDFVREQLAGDLLPADEWRDRRENLTALSFLVLGPNNYELQDKELLRMEVVDEQLSTMGKAFLGMTIGCARCHDHKFDPIPTKDYYALAGIFRSTKSLTPGNVSGYETHKLPVPPEQRRALENYHRKIEPLQKRIEKTQAELKNLRQKLGKSPSRKSQPIAELEGIVVDDREAELQGDWKESTYTPRFVASNYLHDGNSGKGQKSVRFMPDLPAAGVYKVRLSYSAGGNRATNTPVTVHHAEGEKTLRVNQQQKPSIDGLFIELGKFRFQKGGGAVTVSNAGTGNHVIADAVQFLPVDVAGQVAQSKPEKPQPADAALARAKARIAFTEGKLQRLQAELKKLEKTAPPARPVAMGVREQKDPGDYYVCVGGNAHNLGDKVPRGYIRAVENVEAPQIPDDASGRRQLAEWVASPENPLTSRVMVNRIWHHLFGTGLVRTTDNFGKMGERPSHPDLLDWLATRFVEKNWSVKAMVREIMLSRVYRLQSTPTQQARATDPENRLLSHMNRRRLEAEALRDAILSASGRLDLTMHGRTMEPGTNREFGYDFRSNRRSVYVPVFRNTLHNLFDVFDFANPNVVVGHRNTSTLPTQALYMMNSPLILEHSQHAAKRLLAEPDLNRRERVKLAYERILGRPPSPEERELALQFLDEFTGGLSASDNSQETNAWAALCQNLFASLDFRYVE